MAVTGGVSTKINKKNTLTGHRVVERGPLML